MRIFFLDDSGNPSKKSRERYFGFGGFSIHSEELPKLRTIHSGILNSYEGFGFKGDELKFSHVGARSKRSLERNPLHRMGFNTIQKRQFVLDSLAKLSELESIQIIISIVDKENSFGADDKEHGIRTLLERIQKESLDSGEYYLVVCDEEQQHQGILRDVLHEQKSLYEEFTNIGETIFFAPSYLSPGIQFADLVIGSATRMLNFSDTSYFAKIQPFLRRSPWNKDEWLGYGLTIFPKSSQNNLIYVTGGLIPKTTG